MKLARPGHNATGGVVTNVTWANIAIQHPRYTALYVDVFNEDVPPSACVAPTTDPADWLAVSDVVFRNITAVVGAGDVAGCFVCAASRPCTGFEFNDVSITAQATTAELHTAQQRRVASAASVPWAVDQTGPAKPYACWNTKGFSSSGRTSPKPC